MQLGEAVAGRQSARSLTYTVQAEPPSTPLADPNQHDRRAERPTGVESRMEAAIYIYKSRKEGFIMLHTFNIIIEEGEDGYLISEVLELPGCHTQAKTLDKLMKRTKEAINLYLECAKDLHIEERFVGLQQIKVPA